MTRFRPIFANKKRARHEKKKKKEGKRATWIWRGTSGRARAQRTKGWANGPTSREIATQETPDPQRGFFAGGKKKKKGRIKKEIEVGRPEASDRGREAEISEKRAQRIWGKDKKAPSAFEHKEGEKNTINENSEERRFSRGYSTLEKGKKGEKKTEPTPNIEGEKSQSSLTEGTRPTGT